LVVAEMIGLALIGYGIWFGVRGIAMWVGSDKIWWRPLGQKNRYPYPAAGALLGVCFMILGARFALHYLWENAGILGYIGGGIFLIVLVVGVGQPRFLHPRWYGALEDRLGKKGMTRLRTAALKLDVDEWLEIAASENRFIEWANKTVPWPERQSRGYRRNA